MRALWILTALAALLVGGCESDGDGGQPGGPEDDTTSFPEPWPSDLESVLSQSYVDGAGDQEQMPPEQAGPPYSTIMVHPPIDVTQIRLGVDAGFLYMRVEFAGVIPTRRLHVLAEGEVEEQWVANQGMNVAVNSDGLPTGGGGEGVDGIDVFFAIGFAYGEFDQVYCNYGFPTGDLHEALGQRLGELGDGGPGHDFVLARYDVREFDEYLPPGETLWIGSWSEAESYEADGTLKYHHYAYDRAIDGGQFSVPE